jgi:hypothetical protein
MPAARRLIPPAKVDAGNSSKEAIEFINELGGIDLYDEQGRGNRKQV